MSCKPANQMKSSSIFKGYKVQVVPVSGSSVRLTQSRFPPDFPPEDTEFIQLVQELFCDRGRFSTDTRYPV